MKPLTKINANRIEVIDSTKDGEGRAYTKWEEQDMEVHIAVQDDGKTIKIFLYD